MGDNRSDILDVGASLEMGTLNTMQLIAKYAIDIRARGQIDHRTTQNQDLSLKNTLIGYILAGGDDYELAFTAPRAARLQVQAAALDSQTPVTRIGQIEFEAGLRLVDASGALVQTQWRSFDHFA